MDSQKHYQDQQTDSGIGLTPEEFRIKPSNLGDMPNTTPAEFLIKPSSLGDMPNTTLKENVALTGIVVSDLPFISSEDASPRPKIVENFVE